MNRLHGMLLASLVAIGITPTSILGAVPKSAQDAIRDLDGAKTHKDWKLAQDQLDSLGPDAESDLRGFAADKSKDGQKRFYAFRAAIRHLPPNRRKEEVRTAFKQDHDPRFRAHLAFEMGRLKDGELDDVLRKALKDKAESGGVQLAAAWSLAVRGDSIGKERALQAVLEGEEWRDFGMQTLAILRAIDSLPRLKDCSRSVRDYTKRNACRLAQLRIELASADPANQLLLLQSAIDEDGFFDVRGWAAHRLAEIGTPEAGRTLGHIAANRKSPGADAANRGLLEGVEKTRWTREDVSKWMAP